MTPPEIVSCRKAMLAAGIPTSEADDYVRELSPAALAEMCSDLAAEAYPHRVVDPTAVAHGRTLYTTYGCAFCHGVDARGGNGGPNLLHSGRVMRDRNGETIGDVILKGVPNTAMAAFPLTADQLADVAAFLHSFPVELHDPGRYRPASIVTGDANRGRRYFDRQCGACHSVTGDLEGFAARHPDPIKLQQAWINPPRHSPVIASVTESNGATVQGELRRIDEFILTLGFSDGTQRTYVRTASGPNAIIHDPLSQHRELLKVYTDGDIHDVTAYLASFRPTAASANDSRSSAPAAAQSKRDGPTMAAVSSTGLLPAAILQPTDDSWPTYSGDYSARRYSKLEQITQSNVRNLTLAWETHLDSGPSDNLDYPLVVGGEGKGNLPAAGETRIRGAILQVGGVLYLSAPDNAWAVDARDGHVLWHYFWKTRGGIHLGNRGLGMWGNYLYLETPDDYLVSLDARTGKERWRIEIASFDEQYYATTAPVVVGNHVLVGVGLLLDAPGFLQSFDPESGQLQWKHYSVPMNPGDPGLASWKDLDAARHGGGAPWVPGAYDPETHLYIYGTGNPTPAYLTAARGDRDALFTCALIAVDVETGKMAWYYQTSPNDTHDWDSTQTPVLADITVNGSVHKVVMTAARNGYFFVIDRRTGQHLLTNKFSKTVNWAQPKLNDSGQPVRIPAKDNDIAGALVSSANEGAANWPPASYSPQYGLLYVPVAESWAMYYKTETDPRGAMAEGGKEEFSIAADSYLTALDPTTGHTVWSVKYPSRGLLANGVLTTAGHLLFSGDTAGNLVARDPANGQPLWHAYLRDVSNAPETYLLDGQQYILVAAGRALYAFRLY